MGFNSGFKGLIVFKYTDHVIDIYSKIFERDELNRNGSDNPRNTIKLPTSPYKSDWKMTTVAKKSHSRT